MTEHEHELRRQAEQMRVEARHVIAKMLDDAANLYVAARRVATLTPSGDGWVNLSPSDRQALQRAVDRFDVVDVMRHD